MNDLTKKKVVNRKTINCPTPTPMCSDQEPKNTKTNRFNLIKIFKKKILP
jgi:hypothetical protein